MFAERIRQFFKSRKDRVITILIKTDQGTHADVEADVTIDTNSLFANPTCHCGDYRNIAKTICQHIHDHGASQCHVIVTGALLLDVLAGHVENVCRLRKKTVHMAYRQI